LNHCFSSKTREMSAIGTLNFFAVSSTILRSSSSCPAPSSRSPISSRWWRRTSSARSSSISSTVAAGGGVECDGAGPCGACDAANTFFTVRRIKSIGADLASSAEMPSDSRSCTAESRSERKAEMAIMGECSSGASRLISSISTKPSAPGSDSSVMVSAGAPRILSHSRASPAPRAIFTSSPSDAAMWR
jgi:hypothetical protein